MTIHSGPSRPSVSKNPEDVLMASPLRKGLSGNSGAMRVCSPVAYEKQAG